MSEIGVASKVGVFGGSFDPVHHGHLLIAEQAREQLALNEVRFMVANVSPLKQDDSPKATDKQRLEMLELAVGGHPAFQVDDRELQRGGVSFTVDTLRELHREIPDAELFFIMGSDSLDTFGQWHQPEEICRLAHVVVLGRGGHAKPNLEHLRRYASEGAPAGQVLMMPEIEISSTNIRGCCRRDRSIRYQVHPAVEAYIQAHAIYR